MWWPIHHSKFGRYVFLIPQSRDCTSTSYRIFTVRDLHRHYFFIIRHETKLPLSCALSIYALQSTWVPALPQTPWSKRSKLTVKHQIPFSTVFGFAFRFCLTLSFNCMAWAHGRSYHFVTQTISCPVTMAAYLHMPRYVYGLWIICALFSFSPVTVSKDSFILWHINLLYTYMAEK